MSALDLLSFGLRPQLRLQLQTEAAECGLACVAMVLGYHGVVTDIATLRRRHDVSLTGMTLVTLARIAQHEKLATRAVRLELDELPKLRTPCILHWELNHFVVLKEATTTRIRVLDPELGERTYTREEASRAFTGVALEVWPDAGFVPYKEAKPVSLGQLVGRTSGLWSAIGRVLALSFALELIAVASPLFMQWVVDQAIVANDQGLLTTLAIGFFMLMMIQQIIGLFRSWLLLKIGTSIRVQWRSNVFTHLLHLPVEYFHKRHVGDVMSRFGSVDSIQGVLTTTAVETLLDGLMVVVALIMMFIYSPALSWVAILSVLIYTLIRVLWYRPLYRAREEEIVRSAVVSSHVLETLRGVRTIKLFARQDERRSAWQTLFVSSVNAGVRVANLRLFYSIVRNTLSGFFGLLLLWMGAQLVMTNQISLGMLLAFLSYRGQFDSRISDVIGNIIDLRMLRLDAERLGDIVLTEPEPSAPTGLTMGSTKNSDSPEIVVSALKFRYGDANPFVLKGIDLRFNPGQSIAVVGPSGCGKTTMVNLLLGSLRPTEGSIQIGETTLEQLNQDAWRQMVGTVMQDDVLFAGSIADNISFFDPKPDWQRIEEVARMAAIDDDIRAMPMGYQSLVGDMGTSLSGGQKQRVLLARALYKRPKVLILDEATSHLDVKREAQVNRAVARLGMTRIIIAHRPETIRSVDRVVEIDGGLVTYDGVAEAYFRRLDELRRLESESVAGAARGS